MRTPAGIWYTYRRKAPHMASPDHTITPHEDCRTIAYFMFVLVLFLSGFADDRESELFNAGYEYSFAQPDKAAETSGRFQGVPGQFCAGCRMFWLGKTLISLKIICEAEQIFFLP